MKKLLLTIGTITAVATPVATVTACETTTIPNIGTAHPDYWALIDIHGTSYYVNNQHIFMVQMKEDTFRLWVINPDDISKTEFIELDMDYYVLFEDYDYGDW